MKTFVICRMYAGSYIEDKMGGEIINLLHDDNGNNYVYVNPYGYIDKKYNNTVEAVLLTRLLKSGCFEVLGVAKIGKNGQLVFPKGNSTKAKLESTGKQLLAKEEELKIKYGGVKLSDIYKGQLNGSVTFKSEVLYLPKDQIFVTDSKNSNFSEYKNTFNLSDKRFPNQSLISYVTDEANPKSFNIISQMLEDDSLWDKNKKNTVSTDENISTHFNFLNIIKKEDDELVYSNMMCFFFRKYPNLLKSFAKDVLSIQLNDDFSLIRENKNVDIWIEDDNNIIIIENKIKSGINGVSQKHNFCENGFVQSQLSKYYNYTESIKKNKKTHYFIFLPVYSRINLANYSGSKHYTKITYKSLYDFFEKFKIDDTYYKDFVNALYKHTKDRPFDYYEDMRRKFIQQLKSIKL